MTSEQKKIHDVFNMIRNNEVNKLDELSLSILYKSYLLYVRQSDDSYHLSSNGKILRRLLKYNNEFQDELLNACTCANLEEKSFEACLSSAVHFAATYIRCR
ncbi:MAG: hypothetical protein KIT33_09515 [Candidatus Kapabacteria bacterium]|nr:hypothetical protein [Ignavibacteriota bacterium]MCW5885195.1 hypothetical protein [Candidatus Kapabacteria bacterium]